MRDDDQIDPENAILQKLQTHLYTYYQPAKNPVEADLHLSTNEIWKQLLSIFPNELILTKSTVSHWLHEGGFRFYDFGEMRFEWLLKYRSTEGFPG